MSDVAPIPEDTVDLARHAPPADACSALTAFITAMEFLTRLPLSERCAESDAALKCCPIFFPLVGTLIGVFTAVVLGATTLFWPIWLAVIAALAVEARLTGAFHEDAVADFCDAFGGGWTSEDVLMILKDSRIGSYGTLGLGLAVALRAGATIEIMHGYGLENWLGWSSALVASSAVGRWVIVLVIVFVPRVPHRESLSRDIGSQLNRRDLFVATLWLLPAAILFAVQSPWHAALAVALLIPTLFWFVRLVNRRLGGITGDCIGCIAYVSQIVVLLAAAARWQL